ncbi:hypothetical protein PG993_014928 [Apiospora rasikravindrae]|uniref:Uncharacterized protein n=1 Tax=Apiospora rasikravindrae TaxID=990691 RepID=A0ABR1RP44_9PEZI
MFETTKSCCMIQRGFALHGSRRCKREAERIQYIKYSTERGQVGWYACKKCQEEFTKDPSNSAYTPWGFNDLEWQAQDLSDLKGVRYEPELDAPTSG